MLRENKENGNNKNLSEKHRDFGNLAKAQGTLYVRVVNNLNLKITDIAIIVPKFPPIFFFFNFFLFKDTSPRLDNKFSKFCLRN